LHDLQHLVSFISTVKKTVSTFNCELHSGFVCVFLASDIRTNKLLW